MSQIRETTEERPLTGLRILHESTVQEREIDHLGHLNVRFYASRALRATKALAEAVGLAPAVLEALGAELFVSDIFTRHYREQLVGSKLAVRGGVLDAGPASMRFYHELFNTERDELAATFVHRIELRSVWTKAPVALPAEAVERAEAQRVAWPEHGRPRTIDLEAGVQAPDLATLQARGLAMREVKTVREDQCDGFGFLKPTHFMDLLWGGPPPPREAAEQFLFKLENGHLMGWATMESRACLLEMPKPGTRVQGFGAEVEIGRKTSYRHQWLFDVDAGRLLFRFSMLNLAFDIHARRSVEIPANIRAEMDKEYCPELM